MFFNVSLTETITMTTETVEKPTQEVKAENGKGEEAGSATDSDSDADSMPDLEEQDPNAALQQSEVS